MSRSSLLMGWAVAVTLACFRSAPCAGEAGAGALPRVAVIGIEGSADAESRKLAEVVFALAEQELSSAGVAVVDRAAMDKISREIGLALANPQETARAVEVGRLLRADFLVRGTLAIPATNTILLNVTLVESAQAVVRSQASYLLATQALGRTSSELARDVRRALRTEKQPGVTVVVGEIENRSRFARWDYIGRGLRSSLVSALAEEPGLRVLQRDSLQALQAEKDLLDSGIVQPSSRTGPAQPVQAAFWLQGGFTVRFDATNAIADAVFEVVSVDTRKVVAPIQLSQPVSQISGLQSALLREILSALKQKASSAAAYDGEQELAFLRERATRLYALCTITTLYRRDLNLTANNLLLREILEGLYFLDPEDLEMAFSLAVQYLTVPVFRDGLSARLSDDPTFCPENVARAESILERVAAVAPDPFLARYADQMLLNVQLYYLRYPPADGTDPETIRERIRVRAQRMLDAPPGSDASIETGLRRLFLPGASDWTSYSYQRMPPFMWRRRWTGSLTDGVRYLCDGSDPVSDLAICRAFLRQVKIPMPTLRRELKRGNTTLAEIEQLLSGGTFEKGCMDFLVQVCIEDGNIPKAIEYQTQVAEKWRAKRSKSARDALQYLAKLQQDSGQLEAAGKSSVAAEAAKHPERLYEEFTARINEHLSRGEAQQAFAVWREGMKTPARIFFMARSPVYVELRKAGMQEPDCVQVTVKTAAVPVPADVAAGAAHVLGQPWFPGLVAKNPDLLSKLPAAAQTALPGKPVAIAQEDPYLWIVYEGNRIRRHHLTSGHNEDFSLPPPLPEARITACVAHQDVLFLGFVTAEGDLWSVLPGGMARIGPDGQLTLYSEAEAPRSGLISIVCEPHCIWVEDQGLRISVLDLETGAWEEVRKPSPKPARLSRDFPGLRILVNEAPDQLHIRMMRYHCEKPKGAPATCRAIGRDKVVCSVGGLDWVLNTDAVFETEHPPWYETNGLLARDASGRSFPLGWRNGIPATVVQFAKYCDGTLWLRCRYAEPWYTIDEAALKEAARLLLTSASASASASTK